jgi:predicted P-loop ATPase
MHGHSPEKIKERLARHPGGIASKYIDRLDQEVERCYRKWEIKNPKRVTQDGESDWPDITADKNGIRPKKTYRNARLAIQSLGIECSCDRFHGRMLIAGQAINQWAGELSDAANVALRQLIIDTYGFDPGKDNVAEASAALCLENSFDPMLDYLDSLDWDGKARLRRWLTTYFGAEDTRLNRAFGRLTLIAAVRRARKPGCKFDHILTLEGPEGSQKSTGIMTLAGEGNFSDQTILTVADKEVQELVRGVWLFEIAEIAGMKRAEVEKVKAFVTRTHDRARPAYGRNRIDAARRCIFIATTNDENYLPSQTGNRRIWPVKTGAVGSIDIEALKRDRDQLLAEAAQMETTGVPLVLPKQLWATAGKEQDERRTRDPWDDILANASGVLYERADGTGSEEWIKAQDLLFTLGVAPDRATSETYKRLKRVMERLGWRDGRHYFGGRHQVRGYVRQKTAKDSEDGEF